MMTVRPAASPVAAAPTRPTKTMATDAAVKPQPAVPVMALLSFLALTAGVFVTSIAAPM
jgi:hypothetical protein